MPKDKRKDIEMQREIIADANEALGVMAVALARRGGRFIDLRKQSPKPRTCAGENCDDCPTLLC